MSVASKPPSRVNSSPGKHGSGRGGWRFRHPPQKNVSHLKYDSSDCAKAQSLEAWDWCPQVADIFLLSVITCPLTDKAGHVTLAQGRTEQGTTRGIVVVVLTPGAGEGGSVQALKKAGVRGPPPLSEPRVHFQTSVLSEQSRAWQGRARERTVGCGSIGQGMVWWSSWTLCGF